ncbi:MAG: bis(5'-nucleosyl)-tetraphosphatase (symmetrical) YqeK [Oscillospiraceae bacterium]|nr:bis(5'-nucleosyl)-tetraphosphatase (symmetrical) YqeK [Oscillospiraceae bacterium]
MTVHDARKIASEHLSEKRMYHSECVAKCAVQLALRNGADPEKAEIAGLLHDVMKEEPDDALLKCMDGFDIMQDDYFSEYKPVWHSFAGAAYACKVLSLTEDVCDAIYYHTCGKANMSALEECVFLADYISDDRTFPGSQEVREIAKTDIKYAIFSVLQNMISHLVEQGRVVMPLSLEAYNYYASLTSMNKD